MRQKLFDISLLVSKDRKTQVIIIISAILFFLAAFVFDAKPKTNLEKVRRSIGTGASARDEAYQDIAQAVVLDFKKLRDEFYESREENRRFRVEFEEDRRRISEILKRFLEIQSESQKVNTSLSLPTDPPEITELRKGADDLTAATRVGEVFAPQIESFEFVTATAPAALPPEPENIGYIGIGDSVRVELLASLMALTDGTPYPVLFKLVADIQGPDGTSLPLGEARILAAAQGSLPDHRVLFRLINLSVRYPDGSRREFEVDGWIVGEDGLRGMEGVLHDPFGDVIGGEILSSTIEGMGEGFAQSEVQSYGSPYGAAPTLAITGDRTRYAAGNGLNSGAKVWSELLRDQYRKLVPHVEVHSGRHATAIFTKGVKLPGIIEQLISF